MTQRTCTKCKKSKPLADFKNGKTAMCAPCIRKMRISTGKALVGRSTSALQIVTDGRRRNVPVTHAKVHATAATAMSRYMARCEETGKFLHASGQGFTDTREHAWAGTLAQFEKLKEAAGLSDTVSPIRAKHFMRYIELNSPTNA